MREKKRLNKIIIKNKLKNKNTVGHSFGIVHQQVITKGTMD